MRRSLHNVPILLSELPSHMVRLSSISVTSQASEVFPLIGLVRAGNVQPAGLSGTFALGQSSGQGCFGGSLSPDVSARAAESISQWLPKLRRQSSYDACKGSPSSASSDVVTNNEGEE